MERRKQAAEAAKANRDKAREAAVAEDAENSAVLDNLLEKLRNGDNVGRKARRTRPSTGSRSSGPLNLASDGLLASGNDTADLARDMLARLKSDGFDALISSTPTVPTTPHRRSRRRAPSTSAFQGITEELEGSPLMREALAGLQREDSMSSLHGLSASEGDGEPEAPEVAEPAEASPEAEASNES